MPAYAYNQNNYMNQYGGMAGMDAMSNYGNMGQQSAQTGTRAAFAPNMGGATGLNNMGAAMSNMQYPSYSGMGGTEDSNVGMGGWKS